MKKRFDRKVIFLGLFCFFLAAGLSGCQKDEGKEIPVKIFGMDYSQEQEFQSPVQVVCNPDDAWIITASKNDPIHKWSPQVSGVGTEQIEWQTQEESYDLINILERNGTLYAETRNREDDTLVIRKCGMDGVWDTVMSVKTENWEDYTVMGRGFFADDRGNIYLAGRDEVTCFDRDGQKIAACQLKGEVCFWQQGSGGCVECVTADAEGITLYELAENRAEVKWTLKESAGNVHGIQSSAEGTLCLATDGEILFVDRESGSLLSKTDLVRTGVSCVLAGYYDEAGGILQLYSLAGSGTNGIQYSLLSERDASEEQRTALVYGVVKGANSAASSSVRTAINTFNQTDQDYYITIRDYGGNLDRMQADMAAGNGPDIIDMMDTEYYESYVQNGYLEDLTSYLEQSQYKDDIIWNVLDTYKIDGRLYLFVPQFWLKGIVIHPEYEVFVEEWNMETFLELIEKNQWEKDVFDLQGEPQRLLVDYLLSGRQEEFIDWEQETAAFESEEFMDMLALCREYEQAYRTDEADGASYSERKGNSLFMDSLIAGSFISYLNNVDICGREYQIYGYPTLSGETYEVQACLDSCAIYSGSRQKEGAWKFIESLLWESNQKYRGVTNPGLPIRKTVLEELAVEAQNEQIRINGGEALTMTESEIAIVENIIYNKKLRRASLDPEIRLVVQEETAPYFAGDKSAQEVANIIQSRVRLILQE